MTTALVIRQLSSLLDEMLIRETRHCRLTPQDALVMACMVHTPGINAADLAFRLGRKRQNVQRTLERLEDRFMVERHESEVRGRTSGWSLSDHGWEIWEHLERCFKLQDIRLKARGVDLERLLDSLEALMCEVMGTARKDIGLPPIVIPPEAPPDEGSADH